MTEELLESTDTPAQAHRRDEARKLLGFGVSRGDAGNRPEPLLRALRRSGVSIYPVAALGALGIVDTFQAYAFTVLTPNLTHALGLSLGGIAFARALAFLAQTIAPVPMAALSRYMNRALLCIITAAAWSTITLLTGFCVSLLALTAVLVLDGLSTGTVGAIHPPLLVDSYPPTVRVRILSSYTAIAGAGSSVLSPLFVAILAGPFNLTWRGVFFVMGITSLVTTFAATRLRDPGYGKFDTQKVHELGRDQSSERTAAPAIETEDVTLGFFEVFRRLLLIPTIQRLCFGVLIVGIMTVPLSVFVSAYLAERWGLSDSGRGYFFASLAAVSIAGLVAFGRWGERRFRANPSRLVNFCGWTIVVAMAALAGAVVQSTFAAAFALFAVLWTLLAILQPGMQAVMLSLVDARQRPHLASVAGVFLGSGAILGTILLSQVDNEYGLRTAIVLLTIPGIAGGLIIRSARKYVESDLDAMISNILENEDIAALTSSGARLPMLTTRSINFSYGQLQVLFGVDFTVDDGEMVALLGTNGAGKSTLLKVISGIGLPQSGTVRFRGHDITYLDAERRLRLGITQIPGGRAVFGPLDVVENLRAFSAAVGGSKRDVDEAIERCFEAFPRLRERAASPAAALSGGEQQMLGLSKALILRSKLRLLLIDELSLGLAPVIVGQLLDMVKTINQQGSAVVLVEQSVNVALSLVDHAYFMEKGQIRFDGPADQLLNRDDLLRAVFLGKTAVGAS
jgi:ABC-type branched-subunit amino acid transport system ATPase component/sugar phosphate permease